MQNFTFKMYSCFSSWDDSWRSQLRTYSSSDSNAATRCESLALRFSPKTSALFNRRLSTYSLSRERDYPQFASRIALVSPPTSQRWNALRTTFVLVLGCRITTQPQRSTGLLGPALTSSSTSRRRAAFIGPLRAEYKRHSRHG